MQENCEALEVPIELRNEWKESNHERIYHTYYGNLFSEVEGELIVEKVVGYILE